MTNTPENIYLQIGDECPEDIDFKDLHEISWADNRIFHNDIEYTRGDLAESKVKEIIDKVENEKMQHAIAFAKFISSYQEINELFLNTLTLIDGNWYWKEDTDGDCILSEEQLYGWFLKSLTTSPNK